MAALYDFGGNSYKIDSVKSTEQIIFCSIWGEKINTKHKLDKRLLICQESSISLYKSRAFSKDPALSRKFSWFDIVKFGVKNDNQMYFTFEEGEINFKYDHANILAVKIAEFIKSILLEKEMPVINFDDDDSKNSLDLKYCTLMRFRALIFRDGATLKESHLRVFGEYIQSPIKSKSFDCTKFKNFGSIDKYVLEALKIDTTIEELMIPSSGKNSNWEYVAEIIKSSQTLTRVTTSEKFDEKAQAICTSFKANQYSNLQELVFVNNHITDVLVGILEKIIETISLTSLTLSNSMSPRVLKLFLTNIESCDNFKYLQQIKLDSMQELYILTATNICKNIANVAITNCDMEVITFIKNLLKAKDCAIEKFDISKNKLTVPIFQAAFFPTSIKELIMNDMNIDLQYLPSLFNALHNSKTPIIVHLKRMNIVADMWDPVLDAICNITCPELEGLYWDGNVIKGKLLKFFESLPEFKLFGISGYNNEDGSIDDLSDFIATTKSLQTLIIEGTEKKMSTDVMQKILIAIGQNRSLKTINLKSQVLTPEQVVLLVDSLMQNRVIDHINIDRISIQFADLFPFLQTLRKRGAPLKIVYDTSISIPEDKKSEVSLNVRKIGIGDSTISIPEETIKHIDQVRSPGYRTLTVSATTIPSTDQKAPENEKDLEEKESESYYFDYYSDPYSYYYSYSSDDEKEKEKVKTKKEKPKKEGKVKTKKPVQKQPENKPPEEEIPSLLMTPIYGEIPAPVSQSVLQNLIDHYMIKDIIRRVKENDV